MLEIITVDGIKVPIGSHQGKEIVIGSDHRGFAHKSIIIDHLKKNSYKVTDVGTHSKDRCDYPPISDKIGKLVSESNFTKVGIGICGSGIGMLIPASKHKGVYAGRCISKKDAEFSRKHNNTNMLGIGADFISIKASLKIIYAWLYAEFYEDKEKDKRYLDRFVETVKLENNSIK